MNSQELQEKIQELKELQRLAEDLEAEMDAVRDQIKGGSSPRAWTSSRPARTRCVGQR